MGKRSAMTTPLATPPPPTAPSGPGRSAPPQAVASRKEEKSAMRRPRPLSRTLPRSSAPCPGPTPGRSRSPLSKSGVMCPLRSLVLLNKFICHQPERIEIEIAFEQKEILVQRSSYGTKINLPVALLSTHIVSFCNYLKL